MMRRRLLWMLLAAPVVIHALPAQATDLNNLAAAREMLELKGEKALLEAFIKADLPALKTSFRTANPNITDDELNAYGNSVEVELEANLDITIEFEAEEIADTYSADDIKALIDFYRSPAGRRITKLAPAMTKEMNSLHQQWIAHAMERAVKDIDGKKGAGNHT